MTKIVNNSGLNKHSKTAPVVKSPSGLHKSKKCFVKNQVSLYFKLTQSNITVSVVFGGKVLFWTTTKKLLRLKKKRYFYSQFAITVISEAVLLFLSKKFKKKKSLGLTFYFLGLPKFKVSLINLFLKEHLYIEDVFDLTLLAHNGIRAQKKKRLPKKKRRKLIWYNELKLKKKKDFIAFSFIGMHKTYLYDFILRFCKLHFFSFYSFYFFKRSKLELSAIRAPVGYGSHRQKYDDPQHILFFRLAYIRSFFLFRLLNSWLKRVDLGKYNGVLRVKICRTGWKF